MSDPSNRSDRVHHSLDPISIAELRKRVSERRAARTDSGVKDAANKRRYASPPAAEDRMREHYQPLTVTMAPAFNPSEPACTDWPPCDRPAASEVVVSAPMIPELPEEEMALIRAAFAEDERDKAATSAKAMAERAALRRRSTLLIAIVAWILADANSDDEFSHALRVRYISEFAEGRDMPIGLETAFLDSQDVTYKTPPHAHIQYMDTVLRDHAADDCPIEWMLTPGSFGAFRFYELCKYSKGTQACCAALKLLAR